MSPSPSNSSAIPAPPEKRPRRGRPPKIDPAHILKVAREVFLQRGIRATTLEVAERAGVSEGSIFYRFKSKEGLFREAMQLSEDDVPRLLMSAVDSLEGMDIEESLIQFATALVDLAQVGLPLMMMSWCNPASSTYNTDKNAHRFREFTVHLAQFFERHMDTGKLRRMDAEIVSRTFLGSIHHYCMSRLFASEHNISLIPEGMFIRGHVDLLLHGCVADSDAVSSPYARRL